MTKTTLAVQDILGALVGEEMIGTRKVNDPVRIIEKKFSVASSTARKYLKWLANADMATLSRTETGSIAHLFLPPEETVAKLLARRPQPEPRPQKVRADPHAGATAVMVDIDNVVLGFKNEGLTVSFLKLKEHLRATLGTIGFCDAYISPRSGSDSGLIAGLWSAGFDVIICPMGSKDKDAVDEKMRLRGLKYLYTTGIRQVAIVSRDSDFRPLVSEAADHGKQVILVNLLPVMRDLHGADPVIGMPYSRPVQRFLDALERVRAKQPAMLQDPDRAFVTHVASLVQGDFRGTHDDRHPDALSGRIRPRLLQKWGPAYLVQDINAAIKALVESGALRRNGSSALRINGADELWKHIP